MIALRVTARLRGPLTGAPMLDGLVGYVLAARAGLVAGFGDLVDVAIEHVIAREPGGRFHLCSSPHVQWDAHERRYVHRRFPIAEAQLLGEARLRRVNISAGPCKSYRIPSEASFASGDAIAWYCVGDPTVLEEILSAVTHLGRRRAVGRGAIAAWSVEPCAPWGDGFPILREGKPARPLPLDYPGLVEPFERRIETLSFPYWQHEREEVCAVP